MIALTFALPPAKLRANHRQTRFVSGLRAAYSAEMYLSALEQGWRPQAALTGELAVRVTWRQTGHGDVDNTLSATKVIWDALACAPARAAKDMTYLGIMQDDSQIVEITVRRERVATKRAECVVIELWQAGERGESPSRL